MTSGPGTRSLARVLLVVGFVAAWIGYDAWIAAHVVLDRDVTASAAQALVETRAVRNAIADQLTKELAQQVPAITDDPRVVPAIDAALRDPRVASAFAQTVLQIRDAVLSDGSRTNDRFIVDGRALTAAVHDALAPTEPELARQVAKLPPLTVQLDAGNVPHLHDPQPALGAIAAAAIVAAILLLTLSLVLRHDRRAFARLGRRTAYLAITPLLGFVVLPLALDQVSGDAAEVVTVLLRVYRARVLPSAIALAATGLTIVAASILWPRVGRSARDSGTRATDRAPAPDAYTGSTLTRPARPAPDKPEHPAINEKLYL